MPTLAHLNNPEIAYEIWVRWAANEKRHLPSEIAQEPASLLDDVLAIDNYYNALREIKNGSE